MHRHISLSHEPSSSGLTKAIHQIGLQDSTLQAWAHLPCDEPVHSSQSGLLDGLCFGVKDVIDVRGMPTRCGSEFEDDHPAARDAACVAMLRAAGAMPVGKTRTAEFAYRRPPGTHNPAAPGHTPGGSSSGSAAAVAAGMVPFALSTQTGGSIIRPAAYCGVVGFKPSFGMVSRHGLAPGCESLDTIGWHAADIDLACQVGRVVMGRDGFAGLAPADMKKLKILVIDEPGETSPDADTAANLNYIGALLKDNGVTTFGQSAAHTSRLAQYLSLHKVLMTYELARSLRPVVARHSQISAPVQSLLDESQSISFSQYSDAMAFQLQARTDWAAFAGSADLIIAPSAPTAAPLGLENSGSSAYCRAWTYLGWPCLHVPAGTSATDLPIGFQVVMPWRRDFEAFSVARSIWQMHTRHQSTQSLGD